MASKDTVAIFNNTQRIISLKGQVPNKDKTSRTQAKRFCNHLPPGIITFVPTAFWSNYKRNNIVQALVDAEELLVNKQPVKPKVNTAVKTAAEKAQDATLAMLEEVEREEEDD